MRTALHNLYDLRPVRHLLARAAESAAAVSRDTVEGFVAASHEILVNALRHGRPPVELLMWVDGSKLVCRITDAGPGIQDTLFGYRHSDASGPAGLMVARQLCEDVILSNPPRRRLQRAPGHPERGSDSADAVGGRHPYRVMLVAAALGQPVAVSRGVTGRRSPTCGVAFPLRKWRMHQ